MRLRHLIIFLWVVAALAFVRPLQADSPSPGPTPQHRPPNILLIISDDQRYDTMAYMPRTQARIFDQGIAFDRAYVTTSRCCPSRASMLTGLYARNHGVHLNSDLLTVPTVIERLHQAGYFTGVVGKYLNSYPMTEADLPRPEFDYWVTYISGIPTAKYYDTRLNVNGVWQDHTGYQTYILRDYAVDFLRQAAHQDRPFFLMFTPYAPHRPAYPVSGDEDLYLDLEPYRPPGFNEWDLSDKPVWLQANLPLLTIQQIRDIDDLRKRQLQSLNALDIAVEDLLAELEANGELDHTVVFYLSDNGLMWGEHRFENAKVFVYEPSIRVPFAMRYPPLIAEPRMDEHLVANIDLAPTIYELAGLPLPAGVDGRSLVALAQDENAPWRQHLFIEAWPEAVSGLAESGPPFVAVHTGRYVYVQTEGDREEFYDLETDPYQLHNQIKNPAYADEISDLRAIMAEEGVGYPAPDKLSRVSLRTWLAHNWNWLAANARTLYITYRYSPKLWALVGGLLIVGIAVILRKRVVSLHRAD